LLAPITAHPGKSFLAANSVLREGYFDLDKPRFLSISVSQFASKAGGAGNFVQSLDQRRIII
jgi:hypothetical protein